MKTYVFEVQIEQDVDGRWGADIPLLPGCNAWGYTREEALEALQEVAQVFVEIMLEDGDPLPEEARIAGQISAAPWASTADRVTVTL